MTQPTVDDLYNVEPELVIPPEFAKVSEARLAAIPLVELLIEKLVAEKVTVGVDSTELSNILGKFIADLGLFKTIKLDTQELQKIEKSQLERDAKIEKMLDEVRSVLVELKKRETQEVSGTVKVDELKELKKSFDALSDHIIEKLKTPAKPKNEKPIAVRVVDMPAIVDGGKGGATEVRQKRWLREEYQYTTVSGTQVVTRATMWDHDTKRTEDYRYNENAQVITVNAREESNGGIVGTQ